MMHHHFSNERSCDLLQKVGIIIVVNGQSSQAEKNTVEIKPKRYAVVIGINDYSEANNVSSLSFCAADAEVFYDALLTYCDYDPECITLFSDGSHGDARRPLRSDILDAVSNMATKATDQDSVLFFFAGHGTKDARDSYLLTREFRQSVVADTSIPMNMLNEYFRQSKAAFTIRFFDACHSGRIGARGAPIAPDIKNHFLVQGKGWTTLSACEEDQFAHEDPSLGHGIFSYCLIKGLSGEAATPEGEITINSLSMYAITKTTDITNELGLPQTPVLDSLQRGVLVLATVKPTIPTDIPSTLIRVQETSIDQLKPTEEKVPKFIADIRTSLQNDPINLDYISPSHGIKIALGDKLVQKIYVWCKEQEHQYHKQLGGIMTITVKHQSISACPLNLRLAEYIEESKIKKEVGLTKTYRTETVASNSILQAALFNFNTHEVLDGIKEMTGNYMSAVQLTIQNNEPLTPGCAMVIAIIPTSFGLFLLRYSCSTRLDQLQRERWDKDTFSVRTLHAIPFNDGEGDKTLEELQDIYPQLVSLFAESRSARRTYLQNIGALGNSLI